MSVLGRYVFFAHLLAISLTGCGSGRPDDAAAVVENEWLSLADLRIHDELETTEAVENWVNNQVLLFHASRARGPSYPFRTAAEKFALRLQARAFLDSLVRSRIQVSDSLILDHYRRNPDQFVAPAASAHIVHIGFFKRSDADDARRQLSQVSSSEDSLWQGYNLDEKWVVAGRLHPQLEQPIFSAPLQRLIGPIVSEFGFHLIFVQQRLNAGDQIPFVWVKEKIFRSLMLRLWPRVESAVMDSLREETNFEFITD